MSRSFSLVAILLLAGCSPEVRQSTAAPPAPADAAAVAPVSPHGSPRGTEGVLTANGGTLSTPSFAFDLPEGWRSEQPSSSMRLAQVVVPGDAGPGELVLFYFGAGQGGGVEGNFERWRGQVEGAGEGERGVLEGGPYRISWIDLAGTLLPSGMGSGPTTPQPGFRLIGAVAEGESGPYFFKLTGPAATIAGQREAFFALLRSCRRPAGATAV
jgi:hypothetical protein